MSQYFLWLLLKSKRRRSPQSYTFPPPSIHPSTHSYVYLSQGHPVMTCPVPHVRSLSASRCSSTRLSQSVGRSVGRSVQTLRVCSAQESRCLTSLTNYTPPERVHSPLIKSPENIIIRTLDVSSFLSSHLRWAELKRASPPGDQSEPPVKRTNWNRMEKRS